MITQFLIDTLHPKLNRDVFEVLREKGCVEILNKAFQPQRLAEKLMIYTCNDTIVYLVFKGEALFIDIQGEGAAELFEEVSRILPPEHSFVRRVIRGL